MRTAAALTSSKVFTTATFALQLRVSA